MNMERKICMKNSENSSRAICRYFKLLRVKHYLKNFLIFLPIFFGKAIFDTDKILACLLGFLSFSLISSCVYIINDLKDVKKDREHPVKCKRPIASGEISKSNAIITAIVVFLCAIIINIPMYKILNNFIIVLI